jgi:hypothetical protein
LALPAAASAITCCCCQIGFTPLHLSIEHKHDSMVALLLKLGADPDIPNKVRPSGTEDTHMFAWWLSWWV